MSRDGRDISAKLQHPRRSLGNRHRSQAEKFLKLSDKDSTNLKWAEQNARQSVLHDFTNPANWKLLVEIKVLMNDSSGIRAVLEELFTILGRDPELLVQLDGVDMLASGKSLVDAGLRVDPLDPDAWSNKLQNQSDGVEFFAERVRRLDLRDRRANILFSRRLERIRDSGEEDLFIELERILLAQNPSNHEAWTELGRLHERRGEHDQAWLCYDQAQAYFPALPVRDQFKGRMEAKMDGAKVNPWVAPKITERVDFLNRMQRLATPEVAEASQEIIEENETSESDLEHIARLRKEGKQTEAFFLARRLAAEGNEEAKAVLEKLKEELE